jgi:uncharacterized protein YbjT (DUF2867 family)
MTLLVTGATGHVGGEIVRQAAAARHGRDRGLARRAARHKRDRSGGCAAI